MRSRKAANNSRGTTTRGIVGSMRKRSVRHFGTLSVPNCRIHIFVARRTLVEELAKIKSGDVVLLARWADGSERTVHLRCVTTTDEAQKVLLNRRGLTLPQRLRRIGEVAQI